MHFVLKKCINFQKKRLEQIVPWILKHMIWAWKNSIGIHGIYSQHKRHVKKNMKQILSCSWESGIQEKYLHREHECVSVISIHKVANLGIRWNHQGKVTQFWLCIRILRRKFKYRWLNLIHSEDFQRSITVTR